MYNYSISIQMSANLPALEERTEQDIHQKIMNILGATAISGLTMTTACYAANCMAVPERGPALGAVAACLPSAALVAMKVAKSGIFSYVQNRRDNSLQNAVLLGAGIGLKYLGSANGITAIAVGGWLLQAISGLAHVGALATVAYQAIAPHRYFIFRMIEKEMLID